MWGKVCVHRQLASTQRPEYSMDLTHRSLVKSADKPPATCTWQYPLPAPMCQHHPASTRCIATDLGSSSRGALPDGLPPGSKVQLDCFLL